jgi:uridine kinase
MIIHLKKGPRQEFEEMIVDKGTTIEEIYKRLEKELPYTVLAAKVNNKTESLKETLHRECNVELLDMRNHGANLTYQRSVSLIYLKAVKDVLGDVHVEIDNSLNKGVYTEIRMPVAVKEQQVKEISERMQQLIDADIPIKKIMLDKESAISFFMESGLRKKAQLLTQTPQVEELVCYELDGYCNSFYGPMVPSTGYIEHFELKKYHKLYIV